MVPRIEHISEKKLIGKCRQMCFAENTTVELWRSFMPHKKEISKGVDSFLYSLEIYPPDFFIEFNPKRTFKKFATIEVSDFENIPDEMSPLILPSGLYAVFIHKGPASEGPATYNYIFTVWLPQSKYILDQRPHFALMGEKYKNNDPDSEEEIWIPVIPK